MRHGRQAARVGQRPQRGAFGQAIAQLELLRVGDEGLGEFGHDAAVHQKARGRDADLPGVAELGRARRLDGQRHVGVFRHDHRRVPAQLHRHALHVLAGQRGQLLAHGGGAGESHLAHHRVRNQVVGDFGRVAKDQAHHARGHASVHKALQQRRGRSGRFLRRLAQEGATRAQRCANLAHDLVDGEVPRCERGHHAHRLFQHHLHGAHVAARHDAPVHAAAFVGKPFDDFSARVHLHPRFGQRFALLLRQQAGDVVGALAQQGGGTAHQRSALIH